MICLSLLLKWAACRWCFYINLSAKSIAKQATHSITVRDSIAKRLAARGIENLVQIVLFHTRERDKCTLTTLNGINLHLIICRVENWICESINMYKYMEMKALGMHNQVKLASDVTTFSKTDIINRTSVSLRIKGEDVERAQIDWKETEEGGELVFSFGGKKKCIGNSW